MFIFHGICFIFVLFRFLPLYAFLSFYSLLSSTYYVPSIFYLNYLLPKSYPFSIFSLFLSFTPFSFTTLSFRLPCIHFLSFLSLSPSTPASPHYYLFPSRRNSLFPIRSFPLNFPHASSISLPHFFSFVPLTPNPPCIPFFLSFFPSSPSFLSPTSTLPPRFLLSPPPFSPPTTLTSGIQHTSPGLTLWHGWYAKGRPSNWTRIPLHCLVGGNW